MANKTVTMPLELAENLLHCGTTSSFITPAMTTQLRALLAAPAVERQEPVGFRYRANGDWELMEESPFADGREHYKLGGEELQPLYISPPAPVAVVLPEREHVHSKTLPFRDPAIGDGYISGWNACLDKVKEMNQSAAPGFTTVDVATADADGFRSGRKSLGLLFAPAFRTIEQKGGKYSVKLAFEDLADAWAAYEDIAKAAELVVKE